MTLIKLIRTLELAGFTCEKTEVFRHGNDPGVKISKNGNSGIIYGKRIPENANTTDLVEDALQVAERNDFLDYSVSKISEVDTSLIEKYKDFKVVVKKNINNKSAAMGFNREILKEIARNNNCSDLLVAPFSDWNSIVEPINDYEADKLRIALEDDSNLLNPDGLALSNNAYIYSIERDILEAIY